MIVELTFEHISLYGCICFSLTTFFSMLHVILDISLGCVYLPLFLFYHFHICVLIQHQECKVSDAVKRKLDENRTEYKQLSIETESPPPPVICSAAVHIENAITWVSHARIDMIKGYSLLKGFLLCGKVYDHLWFVELKNNYYSFLGIMTKDYWKLTQFIERTWKCQYY